MPRKPEEITPQGGGKMSEETGRELYGGSGSHQGPGSLDAPEEGGVARQSSGPSASGAGGTGHPQGTHKVAKAR